MWRSVRIREPVKKMGGQRNNHQASDFCDQRLAQFSEFGAHRHG